MLFHDIAIEPDRQGQHVVVFPKLVEELNAPEIHGDRLDWIRESYERFFEKIQEKEALLELLGAD